MMNRCTQKPLLFTGWGFSFVLLMSALIAGGCGTSSPRFSGSSDEKSNSKSTAKGSVRFSSEVIEEETKEDDKKVDVGSVARRFSSARPSAAAPKKETAAPPPADISLPGKFEKQKMMDAILGWMGTPYLWGGETKQGIDCSAFSREIFRTSGGMSLPRTTEEQVTLGRPVSRENLEFGDLIFFNTTGQDPSHVGIYIGDDMFAHASVSFGVTLSSLYSSYYKKRYTGARRVLQ